MNSKNFSFIRVFIVAIPIALVFVTTCWILGTTTLRKSVTYKVQQDIYSLNSAIKQYHDRYGKLPDNKPDDFSNN